MQLMIKIFDIPWSLNRKSKAYELWFKWKSNLLGREKASPSQEIWALIFLCVPSFSRLMNRKWWIITLLQSIQLPLRIRIDTGYLLWIFIGRTDAEAEAPILWPPDVKNWLIGKDPDPGKDWRQEKGTTEDQMVGWHHQLDGHEFE